MSKKMIFIVLTILILFGLLMIGASFLVSTPSDTSSLKIGDSLFKVWVADNIFSQDKGLSGKKGLKENEGMLFIFKRYQKPTFWMKDMNFALDFIWIKDSKVVQISKNISVLDKNGNISSLAPLVEIDSVLEINANQADKNNIQIGDEVILTTSDKEHN